MRVRYYSVMRDYGLSPDAVQQPTDHPMVLIGPPDASFGAGAQGDDASDSSGHAATRNPDDSNDAQGAIY